MTLPPDRFWLWCAGACYLAGLVLGTLAVLRERRHSSGLMYGIIISGYLLQTTGLYLRGLEARGCPLGNQFEIFQFTAWSAITLYLVVGPTFRLSLLGYFTSMLGAALTLVSLGIPAWDATRRVNVFGGNAWIEFHAAIALFSYGVFALLALTSILFLMRHFSLKNKRLDGMFAFLPPMVDLDHISLRLLVTGVLMLATSLAVGWAWWIRDLQSVPSSKILVTGGIWLLYTAALGLRLKGKLLSTRLAWVCVALFVASLASLSTLIIHPARPPSHSPAALYRS
jgi:HemX protein